MPALTDWQWEASSSSISSSSSKADNLVGSSSQYQSLRILCCNRTQKRRQDTSDTGSLWYPAPSCQCLTAGPWAAEARPVLQNCCIAATLRRFCLSTEAARNISPPKQCEAVLLQTLEWLCPVRGSRHLVGLRHLLLARLVVGTGPEWLLAPSQQSRDSRTSEAISAGPVWRQALCQRGRRHWAYVVVGTWLTGSGQAANILPRACAAAVQGPGKWPPLALKTKISLVS